MESGTWGPSRARPRTGAKVRFMLLWSCLGSPMFESCYMLPAPVTMVNVPLYLYEAESKKNEARASLVISVSRFL